MYLRSRPLLHIGTIYDFEREGDALPMHDHNGGGAHVSIITLGSFRVYGPWGERVCVQGEVVDLPWPHEFVALVNGARLVNILK